jgi:hypothetical protein
VSKKSDLISRLLEVHTPRRPVPKSEVEDFDLVQQGLYMVLLRHMTEQQAEASVRALQKAYEDWNELRVSQTQEIAQHFRTSTRKKGTDKLISFAPIALELKDYLQEIFQQTHSMSLERFLADPSDGWKMLEKMPVTGITGGAYLAFVAKKEVPVFPSLVKLLDRLGLVAKPGPGKNAIGALVPDGKTREFTVAIYDVLEFWDDPKEPSYVRYPLLQETSHGKKSLVERDSAIAKAESQRKKDEERRKKDDEKERARLAGEEKKRIAAEKQREKAAEVARAKSAKEAERKAKEAAKVAEKKAEAVAKEAERKAEIVAAAAARKAEAAAKEAARKAEIQKRKSEAEAARKAKEAEAKQRAADKKAAEKKAAADKKAALKKAAADKKAAAKKPKKPAAKTVKPAAKKPVKKAAKPAKAKKPAKPAKKPAKR